MKACIQADALVCAMKSRRESDLICPQLNRLFRKFGRYICRALPPTERIKDT
jgi:hypothetical protein